MSGRPRVQAKEQANISCSAEVRYRFARVLRRPPPWAGTTGADSGSP